MCVREGALSREGWRPAGDSRASGGVFAMLAHLPGMKSGMHLAPRLSWNCAPQQVAQPRAARASSCDASTGVDSISCRCRAELLSSRPPLSHDSGETDSVTGILVAQL